MVRQAFRDPRVRSAYIGTKVGVFLIAAIATWPLARMIGPKAWIGLAVFGGFLVLMTVVLLFGGKSSAPINQEADDLESMDDDDGPAATDAPVVIPVEDSIDLHAFPPRDIPDVVDAYLEVAVEKGLAEVRLIHGRGIGVQRDRVQKLLARHSLVSGFHDAPADRGGWGATIAYLKAPKD